MWLSLGGFQEEVKPEDNDVASADRVGNSEQARQPSPTQRHVPTTAEERRREGHRQTVLGVTTFFLSPLYFQSRKMKQRAPSETDRFARFLACPSRLL